MHDNYLISDALDNTCDDRLLGGIHVRSILRRVMSGCLCFFTIAIRERGYGHLAHLDETSSKMRTPREQYFEPIVRRPLYVGKERLSETHGVKRSKWTLLNYGFLRFPVPTRLCAHIDTSNWASYSCTCDCGAVLLRLKFLTH